MTAVSYRTTGAWGAGIGRNLTPAEVDTNFYNIVVAIEALENYPTGAVSPTSITRVGSQITFAYSDGSSFTLTDPVASTPVPATVASVADATYTLVLGDANKYLRFTNVAGCSIQVPTNASVAYPTGTEIHLRQATVSAISFTGASGVTINTPTGFDAATDTQHATVTLKKVATDEWDAFGLLAEEVSA